MLRQSLVNNKFLADLSVKHNFHTLMKYDNPDIFNQINTYVKLHETLKVFESLCFIFIYSLFKFFNLS